MPKRFFRVIYSSPESPTMSLGTYATLKSAEQALKKIIDNGFENHASFESESHYYQVVEIRPEPACKKKQAPGATKGQSVSS